MENETSLNQPESPAKSAAINRPQPPVTKEILDLFIGLGFLIAIAGVIWGGITISNAPKYAFSTQDKALQTAAWVWGIAQIVGGGITAFTFYVIGKIGYAIVDLWHRQFKKPNSEISESAKS